VNFLQDLFKIMKVSKPSCEMIRIVDAITHKLPIPASVQGWVCNLYDESLRKEVNFSQLD